MQNTKTTILNKWYTVLSVSEVGLSSLQCYWATLFSAWELDVCNVNTFCYSLAPLDRILHEWEGIDLLPTRWCVSLYRPIWGRIVSFYMLICLPLENTVFGYYLQEHKSICYSSIGKFWPESYTLMHLTNVDMWHRRNIIS